MRNSFVAFLIMAELMWRVALFTDVAKGTSCFILFPKFVSRFTLCDFILLWEIIDIVRHKVYLFYVAPWTSHMNITYQYVDNTIRRVVLAFGCNERYFQNIGRKTFASDFIWDVMFHHELRWITFHEHWLIGIVNWF